MALNISQQKYGILLAIVDLNLRKKGKRYRYWPIDFCTVNERMKLKSASPSAVLRISTGYPIEMETFYVPYRY
jgi:hypothetical protein